ncbi:MAG: PAS domain S-box protein [Methanomassiliicoccus sp.]|nr:PAS domain S-box protein [Methanomassiliicoccus sp.]
MSSSKFEHIVELANEGIWTLDAAGRIDYINERGAAILGYAPEEMLGHPPTDFLFPADRQGFNGIPGINGQAETQRYEVRARRKDGKAVWLSASTSSIYDDDGRYQGAMAVFSDVTAHRMAEEAMAFQAHLLANAHDAIIALDRDFRVIYWNEMAEWMLGWTALEAIGRHPAGLLRVQVPGSSNEVVFNEAIRKGYYSGEGALCHRCRGEYPVDLRTKVLKDERGEVMEVVISIQDISDRKAAERALKKSEERHRHLVQYAPSAIFEFDFRTMRFRNVNEAVTRISGYSEEELLSMNAFDFIDDESMGRFMEGIAKRLAGVEMSEEVEYSIHTKDGRKLWIDFHLKPIYKDDRLVGAFVVGHDVTEQRAVRERLRESEERLRTVVESSRDGIYMFDVHTARLVFMSPAMAEVTGYSEEELKEMPGEELNEKTHPEDRERMAVSNQAVLAGKDIGEMAEYRWRVKGGEYRWLSDRRRLICDEKGRPTAVAGIIRDITDRKREEQALQESEEHLRLHFDNSPLAVIEWDADFVVTRWAGEAERMFGWTAEEAVGRMITDLDLTYPEDLPIVEETMAQLARRTSDKIVTSNRNLTKGGRVIECTWYHSMLVVGDGKTISVLSLVLDNTARVEAERELMRSANELRRSNAELQQFAYIASHDLQEPLRMVSIYLSLLKKRHGSGLEPEAKEYVSIAMDGADRMRQLVNDLLEYSRVETRERKFRPVDMNRVAAGVKSELRIAIAEASAEVRIDPLPTVLADEVQMRQLMTNLLNNAIKFRGDRKTEVEVTAVGREGEWLFSVRDNGIGVDPKYAEKLFRMFQRLHTRDEYPGTGIGLAIAKKIVERHGGRIWVESDGKSGSTFVFTLPRA